GAEAGAANQRAVDVRLLDELPDITTRNASAIENAGRPGDAVAEELTQHPTDQLDDVVGARTGRGAPGANGPDRLIGDHQTGDRRKSVEPTPQLARDDVVSLSALILGQAVADADDGAQVVRSA